MMDLVLLSLCWAIIVGEDGKMHLQIPYGVWPMEVVGVVVGV
jgi:hypothetical protein